ncbi:Hypothetical_protein [Hexamita inflata]|uniref:Hypothetical_protein n=1 Tax=Hexamita inflata TaxID=28002 RepID=A0AA86UBI6_9EUKA|nr:Hypothetical protein HINF_LOCUS23388 [Hexamita inflata]
MAISSSSLCLVTKSRICIDQRPIQFNILPKQVINYFIDVNFHKLLQHTTQFKWVQSFPGYLNHAVLFNNRYYFTYFDFLYVFDNQQVVQLCQIPRFHHSFRNSWAHVYPSSQIVVYKNNLYVHNSSKQLYVLKRFKNNQHKLKLFRSNQKNRTYFQFNSNIFCVHQNQVCLLLNNFKLQVLLKGQQMIVLFCGGGVLIVQCQNALSSVLVINMLDKEVEPIVDQNIVYYLQNDIQQLLCIGLTGVELKKTILNALLGPEFQQRVQQQCQNQINYQMEEQIYNQKAIYRYKKIVLENKLEKVHTRVQKEYEKIQQRIVEMIKIQQHIVAGFTQFSETDQ